MFNYEDEAWLERIGLPRTYFSRESQSFRYWFRSLLQKIDSSIIIKGLPEQFPEDIFKFILWSCGKIAIHETEQYGLIYSIVTSLSGLHWSFEPTRVGLMNPTFSDIKTLHKDVEVIHLTPDWKGIFDIISFYSKKLAECSKAIQVSLINAKSPMIALCNSKAESELVKAIYDQIEQGESLIVAKPKIETSEMIPRKELFSTWQNDFSKTNLLEVLIQAQEDILNSFYQEVGLPTNIDKSAHVLDREAQHMEAQSQARVACWVANLKESFERVEKLFGLHLEVDYAQNNVANDGLQAPRDGEGLGE